MFLCVVKPDHSKLQIQIGRAKNKLCKCAFLWDGLTAVEGYDSSDAQTAGRWQYFVCRTRQTATAIPGGGSRTL